MKCGKERHHPDIGLGKLYEKETITSHWNMGFTIIKCLTFAIISMRVINVTVTTITSGHPRPGPCYSHQAAMVQHWPRLVAELWIFSLCVASGVAKRGDTLLLPCSQPGTISDIDNLCFVNLVRLPTSPLFFWISGSKPQLNQVYGNNQILIYPKVFNPYWWFLFALFVQKCKWALNKGKGEGGRCHIIGVTSIQIFWSAFLITMIRVWHLSMYWLLIEEKYFRNEMKVVLNVKSSNIFLLAILKKEV